MDLIEKLAASALALIMGAIVGLATTTTPLHYDDGFVNVAARTVNTTQESYGPDPLQVVTLRRPAGATGKTVIFLHGGGWNAGGRGSLEAEAAEWAKTGWVSINVSYRLGVIGGPVDDGKAILADVATVLNTYRAKPYVDPDKVVVYGESAGGHLAEWAGSFYGAKVKAFVAISPVSSIAGAITAGEAPGAPDKVASLGSRAREFFGYSVGTTDSHRYLSRVQHAMIVISTSEWVDPDIHGRVTCTALGEQCELLEYPGDLHAGALVDAHTTEIWRATRHWADLMLAA